MNEILIIHHAGCPDGFGSYWWLRRHLLSRSVMIHVVAASYGDPPPIEQALGRDVWLVDFCYDAASLDQLAEAAVTLTVIDHHQTAVHLVDESSLTRYGSLDEFHQLGCLGALPRTLAVIDQRRSGIGLISDLVAIQGGPRPPAFVLNIEDRDLWRWEYGDSHDVTAAIASYPYDLDVWDALAEKRHEDLVQEGRAINRFRDALIQQVAGSTFPFEVGDLTIECASSPYTIGSDVAGLLAERSSVGVGAYCILHAHHVQVGLRSRKGGPDVAVIAEIYGGGGHPGASGLKLDYELWNQLTGRG
jgi:hypothetical protein